MTTITFLTQLFGATMLLLFAVRMVRTGIERAYGASFKRLMTSSDRTLGLAFGGTVLALILQSSAAVALLVSGFTAAGSMTFAGGLAVVLGGDLGSALLIQVLTLNLDWLVPVLLVVGGFLFLKCERRKLKQAGRIIFGIAFILISLRFLREAVDPIRDSAFLPAIAGYLERDFLTAFLTGAALAFVMHSSVAAILMCVTVVAIGALPLSVGVSIVLGANLGSALIPVWLTRGMGPKAQHVPYGNLMIRGAAALILLVAVNRLPILPLVGGLGDAQALVVIHIAFNAALWLALPFLGLLERPINGLIPIPNEAATAVPAHHRSVLDAADITSAQIALASVKREVLRMLQVVEEMVAPVMPLYFDYDKALMQELRQRDTVVNAGLDSIRTYVAAVPDGIMAKAEQKQMRALVEYAIALETAGDIVVKRLLSLTAQKSAENLRFSKAGKAELISMHERLLANISLASNVLVSEDLESARLLLAEKSEMARLERASRKKHLKRLSTGETHSFASSDIHLETAHALRDMNSNIAMVSYPILYSHGQLLESRLIHEVDAEMLSD